MYFHGSRNVGYLNCRARGIVDAVHSDTRVNGIAIAKNVQIRGFCDSSFTFIPKTLDINCAGIKKNASAVS